ncbi:unnamed protein product [Phyllotreta striolata]|uniref:Uncharacterized protein n=1 Tax=Phyllotreta striolata TaxID=444603 RepID=A0A9N9TLJ1_PHYSR|nr:unnamed protein product [Phyllotreta striolata]
MTIDKTVTLENKSVHCPTDTSSSKDEDKLLSKIKEDVKAVIELMGPNTPHIEPTFSVSEDSVTPMSHNNKDPIPEDDFQTDNDFSTLPADVTATQETDFSLTIDEPNLTQQICPPPIYPANNFVYNSECMCPQLVDYMQKKQVSHRPKSEKTKFMHSVYNFFKDKKSNCPRKGDFYTIKVKKSSSLGHPKRLVFDLVEDMGKTSKQNGLFKDYNSNRGNYKHQYLAKSDDDKRKNEEQKCKTAEKTVCQKFNHKVAYTDCNGTTRVDVYYFDHGCSNYYQTTDKSPVLSTDLIAERTESYTTRFWAELFGTFHIGFSFLTSFLLQLLRFVLQTVVRPMTVGMFHLLSDYFLKPILCAIFNALVQPVLIFLLNVASSIRDFCDPIAETIGFFIRELSAPIRAFRIVEVRKEGAVGCGKDTDVINKRVLKKGYRNNADYI